MWLTLWWTEVIMVPVGQKLGPGSWGWGQVDGQVTPPGMGDGYAHNYMLQVVDMVVGVIRAARRFVDGAHSTVGANCPTTEREGVWVRALAKRACRPRMTSHNVIQAAGRWTLKDTGLSPNGWVTERINTLDSGKDALERKGGIEGLLPSHR